MIAWTVEEALQEKTLHLITYSCGNRFDAEKFQPVRSQRHYYKPAGGLWASPTTAEHGWRWWCEAEEYSDPLNEAFIFEYTGRVLTIDGLMDLDLIPPDVDSQLAGSGWKPDYDALGNAGVDAIHLTWRGQVATRYSHPKNLNGWDCESVLIFNPSGINEVVT